MSRGGCRLFELQDGASEVIRASGPALRSWTVIRRVVLASGYTLLE
jgi:hypothetical protein